MFNDIKLNSFQALSFPKENHEEPSHSQSSPLNPWASGNPRASNPRESCSIGNSITVTPHEAKVKAQELVEDIRVLERLKKRLEEELEFMLKISSQE